MGAQGDYPPRKLDPVLSSSPLISKDMAHASGPQPFAERPTEMDMVDLVTGRPLVQEIDFELPFGGAVFRHVRTYSEHAPRSPSWWRLTDQTIWWDWNGVQWMMSENPILLIDANYCWTPRGNNKQMLYLLLDAHHSIPFEYSAEQSLAVGKPFYWAPMWFDAMVETVGGAIDGNGAVTQPPSQFKIWLHRNSVCYTFQAVYDDVPADMHAAPTGCRRRSEHAVNPPV